MRKLLLSLAAALCVWAGFAATGDDWGFYYQAEVRNASGSVICDGDGKPVHKQTVTIKLYEQEKDTKAVWGKTYSVACDDNGLFNVFVADSTGTSPSVSGQSLETAFRNSYLGDGLFIGLAIGTSPEIKPRQRIRPVPFASVANVAHELAGNPAVIEGDFVVDGSVLVAPGNLTVTNLQVAGDLNLRTISVPIRGIILWNKDTPPTSTWKGTVSEDGMWAICDGNNDTPDLTGRFPVMLGGAHKTLLEKGGTTNEVLTIAAIPEHRHLLLWDVTARNLYDNLVNFVGKSKTVDTLHFQYAGVFCKGGKYISWRTGAKDGYDGTVWTSDYPSPNPWACVTIAWELWTGSAGVDAVLGHENMPPYRALYYIMRVK